MPVQGRLSVTLEVPTLDQRIKIYNDAGLTEEGDGAVARFRFKSRDRNSIILIGGAEKKRLHHLALRAERLDGIATRVLGAGGTFVGPPSGVEDR